MDFLEIFASGRYHRDMKVLKILASNFKWFKFMAFLRNYKLMMISGDPQTKQFLRELLVKITSGMKL